MFSTLKKHEKVLRRRCHNGRLYRNDAKLADWLGIEPEQVKDVLDSLVAASVLLPQGVSSKGSETFLFSAPAALSEDACRLYQQMLALATAEGVVNVANNAELASAAGMDVNKTVWAYGELRDNGLVREQTFGDRRFPVLLRRFDLEAVNA
jgi:hypothetical protein